ncbi:tRNA(Met) cytidine acetyltransferase TmcA [Halomicrococcus sp. SG-WS-1]|uniref:tRNA(Met) cytidine acetyltransferase TmcA n=1 Tax=Halomicrococcus sp. SG-WS-1 TaxID=3439057 RepID=UPI003F7A9741
MDVEELAAALAAEARRANERRLLVLAGDRAATVDAARRALDAAGISREATTQVAPERALDCERVGQHRAAELLGTTRAAVVFDAHDELHPNAVGRVVGAVDGGGLFLLLAPALDAWPDRRDEFDASLAVPPFETSDVTGRFRERFVATLRTRPGVAVVDVDAGTVERDGLTDPAPRLARREASIPADRQFPRAAYEACRTGDQVAAVRALEALRETTASPAAVVVEADRGRGKSSAAGIAAGALAAEGSDVVVTAPEYRSAREAFVRSGALLDSLGELAGTDGDPPRRVASEDGSVRFATPTAAADAVDAADEEGPDAVLVDEAAALPVHLLERFLGCPRVAFTTTVHGYEGAGRGFSVRFRDRLDESDHDVSEVSMVEPIRYVAGDPVEVWAFDALALDARPAVDPLVADADPAGTEYRTLDPDDLLADEHLLREAFGLLVLAHYRTEPADLARLLDAPNVAVRALCRDGHVVSVALLAREGNLPASVREHMYEGGRVRGNMLPDVLTSQLRDEDAGRPEGLRVMRIATHHAVRSRGLGSRLLAEIRAEFAGEVDWLGTGFGATPELLGFWRENGYRAVQLSTTRNDASGEHSALLLDPTSDAGRDLHDRTARRFVGRIAAVLSDALSDLDPDVARATLRAVDAPVALDCTDWEWRMVAASAYGPGQFDQDPAPFRRLAVKHLVESDCDLSPRQERLLVRKVLQARGWPRVADELGFHSAGQAMRALGEAFRPLVDRYGTDAAREERERYTD